MDKLVVDKMCDTHNHGTSETLFNNLPNQRRMTPKNKSDIIQLMDMRANKKLIQDKYLTETRKIITLKDLSNIRTKGIYIMCTLFFFL